MNKLLTTPEVNALFLIVGVFLLKPLSQSVNVEVQVT